MQHHGGPNQQGQVHRSHWYQTPLVFPLSHNWDVLGHSGFYILKTKQKWLNWWGIILFKWHIENVVTAAFVKMLPYYWTQTKQIIKKNKSVELKIEPCRTPKDRRADKKSYADFCLSDLNQFKVETQIFTWKMQSKILWPIVWNAKSSNNHMFTKIICHKHVIEMSYLSQFCGWYFHLH